MATQKRFIVKNGLDNNSLTITNLADPVNITDAVTKSFSTNAANLTSGTINIARLGTSGTATSTTFLRGDNTWATAGSTNAADLTSGTLNVLRLGDSGTRDSTTYLRGDNTWATIVAGETSATTATANTVAKRDANGDIYAMNFVSMSDINLKTNILPLETQFNSLNVISNIQPKQYTFLSDESSKIHYGVIAQDLETILPNLVSIDDNGNKAVSYIELIPFLIDSIKSLKAEIDTLKGV